MLLKKLRRSGGSLVITIPAAFVRANGLTHGSRMEVLIDGATMTLRVQRRPRYRLAELLAEMPDGLPRLEGWDEFPPVGAER